MIPLGKDLLLDISSPEEMTATIVHDKQRYDYDLATLLDFKADLEGAMATHSAHQAYWETTAIDILFRAREFEEQGYAKWWAHARRHARHWLRATGQKDTIESVKDAVVTIFSDNVAPERFAECAQQAYRGSLIEKYGSEAKADKAIATKIAPPFDQFFSGMRIYVDAKWTYEAVVSTLRTLEESAKKAAAIAKTLNDRSFKMRDYAELTRQKHGNTGPMTVRGPAPNRSEFQLRDMLQIGTCDLCGGVVVETPSGPLCDHCGGGVPYSRSSQ